MIVRLVIAAFFLFLAGPTAGYAADRAQHDCTDVTESSSDGAPRHVMIHDMATMQSMSQSGDTDCDYACGCYVGQLASSAVVPSSNLIVTLYRTVTVDLDHTIFPLSGRAVVPVNPPPIV